MIYPILGNRYKFFACHILTNYYNFLGFLPFNENIIEADLDGRPPYEKDPEGLKIVSEMMKGYFD